MNRAGRPTAGGRSPERQRAYFSRARQDHFLWLTANPYMREAEEDLLACLRGHLAGRVLEVGCGEGANLFHFREAPARFTGLDYIHAKVRAARANVPGASFACGDAGALPFRDGAFPFVFCRDLLHHVPDPGAAAREMLRVCADGGHAAFMEANGRTPIWTAWGLAMPAERGMLRSTRRRIEGILREAGAGGGTVFFRGSPPLGRLVFHVDYGLPSLARIPAVKRLFLLVDRFLARATPAPLRSYIVAVVRKPARGVPDAR